MSSETERTRLSHLCRVFLLVDDLLGGRAHDRDSIAERLMIKPASADRLIRAIIKRVHPIECRIVNRKRTISLAPVSTTRARVPVSVLVAACFGASLAPLFSGSTYEAGIREAAKTLHRWGAKRPERFREIERKFIFLSRGGEMSLPEKAGDLDEIVDALLGGERIKVRYQDFNDDVTQQEVEPLSLVIYDHQLYLLCRHPGLEVRTFRLSRIVGVERGSQSFEYPTKAEYDPERIFRDSFGIFVGDGQPERVVLRLTGRWAHYAETHRWHSSHRSRREASDVLVEVRVRVCPEVEQWILSFGDEAEVLEPATLRAKVAARLEKAAKRYA